MPPRGQHGYELPASQTNKYGQRKTPTKNTGFGSWGGGLGLTPQALAGFYAKPENQNNQFYQSYLASRSSIEASNAASQKAQQEALLRQRAAENAQRQVVWARNAAALQAALRGKSSVAANRLVEYYGLDLKSQKGRAQAAQFAKTAAQLAFVAAAGSSEGQRYLNKFSTQVHKAARNRLHQEFLLEQARLEQQAQAERDSKFYGAGGGILGGLRGGLRFLGDVTGITDSGHDPGLAFEHTYGKFIKPSLGALEKLNIFQTAAYAAEHQLAHGGGIGGATAAAFGSLERTVATPFGVSDNALDYFYTNSQIESIHGTSNEEQRQKLTKSGDLISLGQFVTGQWDRFNGSSLHSLEKSMLGKLTAVPWNPVGRHGVRLEIAGHDLISGTADLTIQVIDPFLVGGKVLRKLGYSSELGSRAVRAAAREEAARVAALEAEKAAAAQVERNVAREAAVAAEKAAKATGTNALQRAAKAAAAAATPTGTPSELNQKLLRLGGTRVEDTVTLYRGEAAQFSEAARGTHFTVPENATAEEAQRAIDYARNFAGKDGIVYQVRVPKSVAEAGQALAKAAGHVGAVLPEQWADAAYRHSGGLLQDAAVAERGAIARQAAREAGAVRRVLPTAAVNDIIREHRLLYTTSHVFRGVETETVRGLMKQGIRNENVVLNILGRKTTGAAFRDTVLKAMREGDELAVRQALRAGFVAGVWRPERKLFGQVLRRMGYIGTAPATRLPTLLAKVRDFGSKVRYGEDVVDPTTGEVLFRKGARKYVTVTSADNVDDVLDTTIERFLAHAKKKDKTFYFGGELLAKVSERAPLLPIARIEELLRAGDTLGNPQFRALVEDISASAIGKAKRKTAAAANMLSEFVRNSTIPREWPTLMSSLSVAEQDALIRRLDFATAVAEMLRGSFGEDGRAIAIETLASWTRKGEGSALDILTKAHTLNMAVGWAYDKDTLEFFKNVPKDVSSQWFEGLFGAAGRNPIGNPELREWFQQAVASAPEGGNTYGTLLQAGHLISEMDDATRDHFENILMNSIESVSAERAARTVINQASVSRPAALLRAASRTATGFVDQRALTTLRTLSNEFTGENRERIGDFFYRYGAAMGASTEELSQIQKMAAKLARNIERGGDATQAKSTLQELVRLAFKRAGLTKDAADEWVEFHTTDWFRHTITDREQAFLAVRRQGDADVLGLTDNQFELLNRPVFASQRQTTFKTVDVDHLLAGVRDTLLKQRKAATQRLTGTSKLVAEVERLLDPALWRQAANRPLDARLIGGLTARQALNKLHRLWKVMVTTYTFLPLVAFAGTLAYTGDFQQAATIGAITATGGWARYRLRLSIQNRIDGVLYHGFAPEEWVPFYGRFWTKRQRKEYGMAYNALRPDVENSPWYDGAIGRLYRSDEGAGWRAFTPTGSRVNVENYVNALDRVVNFQVNPELDEVVHILLNERAGYVTRDEANELLVGFLNSEDGRFWRAKNQVGRRSANIKNIDKFVERPRLGIETVFPQDGELAKLRLEAFGQGNSVSQDDLRRLLTDGRVPDAVAGKEVRNVLRNPRDIFRTWRQGYERAAYGGETSLSYREQFFAVERKRQKAALVANGVPENEADQIAGNLALRLTNDVMFRYDNVSRFAHQVDFFAPFTGHRLFNAQSWTKAVLNNPGRAIRVAEQAARAWQHAVNNDVVSKDPYGTWVFTIPGSGTLSKAVGAMFGADPQALASSQKLTVNATGFLAMASEMSHAAEGGTNPASAFVEAAAPHPGGIWWSLMTKTIKETAPELIGPDSPLPKGVVDYLWGYKTTSIVPANVSPWMAMLVAGNPVFDLLDDGQGEDLLNKMEVQAYQDLQYEHLQNYPQQEGWEPTYDQVKARVTALMSLQALVRGIAPATPHFRWLHKEEFYKQFDIWLGPRKFAHYTPSEYSDLRRQFVEQHPAFLPFMTSNYEWNDNSFGSWLAGTAGITPSDTTSPARLEELSSATWMGRRRQRTLDEYRTAMRQSRRLSDYFADYNEAFAIPNQVERQRALDAVDLKYPDEKKYRYNSVHAEQELEAILRMSPGTLRDSQLDNWSRRFAPAGQARLSPSTFVSMRNRIHARWREGRGMSPWKMARAGVDIWKDVGIANPVRRDGSIKQEAMLAMAKLDPAEQVIYMNEVLYRLDSNVAFREMDPHKFMNTWFALKAIRGQVFANNPDLVRTKDFANATEADVYEFEQRKKLSDQFEMANTIRQQKNDVYQQLQRYADAKQWGAYYKLKPQYDQLKKNYLATVDGFYNAPLRAHIKETLQNLEFGTKAQVKWSQAVLKNLDQTGALSTELHNAIRELTWVTDHGASTEQSLQAWKSVRTALSHGAYFQPTVEDSFYLGLPSGARQAYVNDLTISMNLGAENPDRGSFYDVSAWLEAAKGADGVGGGKYGINVPLYWNQLTDFQRELLQKHVDPTTVMAWQGVDPKASASSGRRRGARSIGASELSYAYAMLKKYSQRAGMAKPAAYDEYLALPNNPAVRNAFLEDHPEVSAYIKAGPMANMPAIIRYIVQDIMVRNGKWDGEPKDIGAITDIAFAREQLQRYNKRTGPAPATYDLWLNMPSGPEKAAYLAAHPEIKTWIQLGPMAQMPGIYRDVVRDIMYRYHEWSAGTDGMGTTIADYYRTPTYARAKYLAEHPELAAYWQATRSAEDQAMGAKVDAYFATPDPGAKAAMLAAYPELKQYFLDSRMRRYEAFLNQVAQYMGQNPDLFTAYLDQQNAVLQDLFEKFATPNIAAETHWVRPQRTKTASTEAGRVRGA